MPKPIDPDVVNDHRYEFDWEAHDRAKADRKANRFWNDERVAALRDLWGKDLRAVEIGKHLGCTKMAVIGKANRLGLPMRDPRAFIIPFPKPVKGRVRTWTIERDRSLRVLWDQRVPLSEMSQTLGVTQEAIKKRAARIGLTRREPLKRAA